MDITYKQRTESRLILDTIKPGVPLKFNARGAVYIKLAGSYVPESKHCKVFNLSCNKEVTFHKETTVYCYYPTSNLMLGDETDLMIICG